MLLKIRIAVATRDTSADRDQLLELVDGLEARGFDTIWLSDTPLLPGVEPLTALALAAGRTERIRLGTNVVVPGHNPLLLARALAHLDRLSSGRLLLALMPGLGTPAERGALGVVDVDRLSLIARTIELCRAWWAGQAVSAELGSLRYEQVTLSPGPIQDPLEIWLGGNGPRSLELTGTHGDGWLGARVTPEQAGRNRLAIKEAAAAAGRSIDEDHYGISIPYARLPVDGAVLAAALERTDAERADVFPIGGLELRELLLRHIDVGLTKFVLRPMTLEDGWDAELDFLAEHALPVQN